MFIWIMPLLAAGLMFVDNPDSPRLSERPAELMAWVLTAFVLAGEAFIFGMTWWHVRQTRPMARTYYWSAMFRSTIMMPTPALVLWPHRIGAIAITLAALLTWRPELAAGWIAASAMGLARRYWENKTVKRALAAIDSNPGEQGA